MAKIVKLSALLPEDIVFELPGGARYTFPGDPPLELILKIASLFERAENAGDEEADGLGLEILRELDEEVLKLMRMRVPETESSPFGVAGVQAVVAELLKAYNFAVVEEADEDRPPPKKPAKSRSSRGSRSS